MITGDAMNRSHAHAAGARLRRASRRSAARPAASQPGCTGVGPPFEQGAPRTGRCGRRRWKPNAVIADKAYPAMWLLEAWRRKPIAPIIPNRPDQPGNPDFDHTAYRRQNLVERLVGKLKRFRRMATRRDQCDAHHGAVVQIASIMVWRRRVGDRT